MQMTKNKTTAIAIAIFLTLSMAASTMLIPTTSAHTPAYQIKTYAEITTLPDTVGVGQRIWIYAFLGNAPLPGSTIANTYRFHNYTVTVTDPNGIITIFHYDTVIDTTGVQFITISSNRSRSYTT